MGRHSAIRNNPASSAPHADTHSPVAPIRFRRPSVWLRCTSVGQQGRMSEPRRRLRSRGMGSAPTVGSHSSQRARARTCASAHAQHRLHLNFPFAGSRMLRDLLKFEGVKTRRKHVPPSCAKWALRRSTVGRIPFNAAWHIGVPVSAAPLRDRACNKEARGRAVARDRGLEGVLSGKIVTPIDRPAGS